jgi:L-ascorbate metabolism protein UlaG (beta-lactamase superfamily)
VVDLSPPGGDELRLVYLGAGGWILEHGDDMVLTGPLFSNPGFVRTGLWSFQSDQAVVDRQMSRYDVARTRAILVGHAHYDHLMDVPRVALAHAPSARIVGSRTVANTLGTWSGVSHLVDVVDAPADVEHVAPWLHYGPGVRVMALRSHHAPHFDGYTLYSGTRTRPLTEMPRTAEEWVDGETFAFLIDFLDADGAVAFRLYYQDAVVAPPLGFAPDRLIAERPVDVAIFVPATFDQVDWHPEAFVENLRPHRVLLTHWEDFFVPIDTRTKSIMMTDIGHFQNRLERVFGGEWWRPEIGTEFRFPRR